MAEGPLAGIFWRVLNALDYSDAARPWLADAVGLRCVGLRCVGR
jgi:hypothetical protein